MTNTRTTTWNYPLGFIPVVGIYYEHRYMLTHPFRWTNDYLKMIGCNFHLVDQKTTSESVATGLSSTIPGYHGMARDTRILARCIGITVKREMMHKLLMTSGPFFADVDPPATLFFNCEEAHTPNFSLYRRRGLPQDLIHQRIPAYIGYTDYSSIIAGRFQNFPVEIDPATGRPNLPVRRWAAKCIKMVTPENYVEDPYILAILIALAQHQEAAVINYGIVPKPFSFVSRLVITNWIDTDYIYVYDANFPHTLVKVLHRPDAAGVYIPWPVIQVQKIPYEPYGTFMARLYAALIAPALNMVPSEDSDVDGQEEFETPWFEDEGETTEEDTEDENEIDVQHGSKRCWTEFDGETTEEDTENDEGVGEERAAKRLCQRD
ncbi:hypothetical protein BJY04DRAFT_217188 [Aspergillus karnatakaensis]|uniref:uncharacterized protein n=1 Tax=Aspergillus karnatakaensis TaxID=1810916 RepID=UPI003CCD60B0